MNRQDHLLVAINTIGQLSSIHESNHSIRIKLAARAVDSLNAFICAEVLDAVDKTRPGYMTWDQIAETMGLSKSAAWSRYGKKRG